MISLVKCISRPLQVRTAYRYLTSIEKPITSLALNSIIEASSEAMQYCSLEYAFPSELSVVAGAFFFRIGIELAGLFFKSLVYKHKDSWVNRWIEKIFLIDLRRDVTFYELSHYQQLQMQQNYRPEVLFTTFLKTYTLLNFLRGAHYIIASPQLSSFYNSHLLPLYANDPYFILPIVVTGLNFLIISKSEHPFLIHLVRKENKLMCFNIAFMSGLLFVPTPAIYPLAYIGIASSHLVMRMCRYRYQQWKDYLKSYIKNWRSLFK